MGELYGIPRRPKLLPRVVESYEAWGRLEVASPLADDTGTSAPD